MDSNYTQRKQTSFPPQICAGEWLYHFVGLLECEEEFNEGLKLGEPEQKCDTLFQNIN